MQSPEEVRQEIKDDMLKYNISASQVIHRTNPAFTGFHKYLLGTDSSVKHVSQARVALTELIGQDLCRNTVTLRKMTSAERTALLNKAGDLTQYVLVQLGIREAETN